MYDICMYLGKIRIESVFQLQRLHRRLRHDVQPNSLFIPGDP